MLLQVILERHWKVLLHDFLLLLTFLERLSKVNEKVTPKSTPLLQEVNVMVHVRSDPFCNDHLHFYLVTIHVNEHPPPFFYNVS